MARKTVINVNAPAETVAKINPKNIELMDEYLDYMVSMQRSPNTVEAYRVDLLGAFCWCVEHNDNLFFIDWTKRQFIKYQKYMIQDLKNSPARVKRVKAVLSSMSNFIENVLDEDYPNFRNKVKNIESPVNEPVREKTILTDDQINHMLQKFTSDGYYDKACMLALAVYSGRRRSELVRFRVSDFDDDHLIFNGALYKSDPIKTKGRGAAGKMLNCFTIAKPFRPYLNEWLLYRDRLGIESEWLFPDREDPTKHMDQSSLASWARTISNELEIDFYWHSVRHRTVTKFKEMGYPDTAIQSFIGWSDISMVPVYSDIGVEEELGMYFDGSTEDGFKKIERKSLSDL